MIPESVKLKKLVSNEWVLKPTQLLSNDGNYVLYEASVGNLSTFAIVGKRTAGAVARLPEAEKPEVQKPVAQPEEAKVQESERTVQPETSKEGAEKGILGKIGGFSFAAKVVLALVLVIAGILVAVEVMHFMHRKLPPLKLPKIPQPPIIK